jgi:hypothetical protein
MSFDAARIEACEARLDARGVDFDYGSASPRLIVFVGAQDAWFSGA